MFLHGLLFVRYSISAVDLLSSHHVQRIVQSKTGDQRQERTCNCVRLEALCFLAAARRNRSDPMITVDRRSSVGCSLVECPNSSLLAMPVSVCFLYAAVTWWIHYFAGKPLTFARPPPVSQRDDGHAPTLPTRSAPLSRSVLSPPSAPQAPPNRGLPSPPPASPSPSSSPAPISRGILPSSRPSAALLFIRTAQQTYIPPPAPPPPSSSPALSNRGVPPAPLAPSPAATSQIAASPPSRLILAGTGEDRSRHASAFAYSPTSTTYVPSAPALPRMSPHCLRDHHLVPPPPGRPSPQQPQKMNRLHPGP